MLGLEHYREVSVFDFQFGSQEAVVVDKSKLKTAVLLACLAKIVQLPKSCPIFVFGGTKIGTAVTFNFVKDMRKVVEEYYVNEFCNEVRNNPETAHTSLKEMLLIENPTRTSLRLIKPKELDSTLSHLAKQEAIGNLGKFNTSLVAAVKEFGTVFHERGTTTKLHPFLKST